MFAGFESRTIEVDGVAIHARVGGGGPPLLLLHGYPHTHVAWHKVAPDLARSYTVVAADLRGYGDSAKPAGGDDHAGYSKRAMAADQVGVMRALGFDRFLVAGHDRGGRVAHRLALDFPDRVEKLAVLDIAPTLAMYRGTTDRFARDYYHWFFLIQPADLPERLIGADPGYYLRTKLASGPAGLAPFTAEAMAEYVRCFDPATIHASCEDYRASWGIDLAHDEADLGRKVACPLLVLWGESGAVQRHFDALALWRERADRVEGEALPGGHSLMEEVPDLVLGRLQAFFAARH